MRCGARVPLVVLRNAGARPQRRGAQQWLTETKNTGRGWPTYRATEDPSKVPRRQFVRVTCSSGRYAPADLFFIPFCGGPFLSLPLTSRPPLEGLQRERERGRERERERERERQYQFEFSGESSVDLDANCDSWPPRMKNTLLPLRWCFSDDYMTLMERNFYSLKARALVKKSSALQRRIY